MSLFNIAPSLRAPQEPRVQALAGLAPPCPMHVGASAVWQNAAAALSLRSSPLSHRPPGAPEDEPAPQPVEPDQGPAPGQPGDAPPQHSRGLKAWTV